MKLRYIENNKNIQEFNYLTDKVGWGTRDEEIVKRFLGSTLYSISIYDEEKIIGYGRIIGAETIFVYIQDVMVIPSYQNKKLVQKLCLNF